MAEQVMDTMSAIASLARLTEDGLTLDEMHRLSDFLDEEGILEQLSELGLGEQLEKNGVLGRLFIEQFGPSETVVVWHKKIVNWSAWHLEAGCSVHGIASRVKAIETVRQKVHQFLDDAQAKPESERTQDEKKVLAFMTHRALEGQGVAGIAGAEAPGD
jgi:hypothetical protein